MLHDFEDHEGHGFPMALASTEAAFMDSNQPPSPLTNLPEVDVADFHGEK